MAGLDGLDGLRPGRVDHALESQEDQTRFHLFVGDLVGVGRELLAREGQDSQALGGHVHGHLLPALRVEWLQRAVVRQLRRTAGQHLLHRPFHVGDPARTVESMKRGHVLVLGFEGHCVQSREHVLETFIVQTGFGRRDYERAFSGVAVHVPVPVLEEDGTVVAERPSSKSLEQRQGYFRSCARIRFRVCIQILVRAMLDTRDQDPFHVRDGALRCVSSSEDSI